MSELSPAPARAVWVKSSYSNGDGGGCVEWAPALSATGTVPVRDSKVPDGPALAFPRTGWAAFVTAVKDDRLPG
ncbi:DUF397 domain-containing protein [Streptomyces sp. JJ38]|uniref:DUF397 domain-containing protein n=1 Tax=Streptomyces sp. JJ38 TaxID=2738128 RepID=UPI001C59E34B|nr:DUF397 domain-containing protein [Streptomyces sp. JJ38]MBW1596633.1 DUF397 domain-containing protein [Streptomyces sp. JJ38]